MEYRESHPSLNLSSHIKLFWSLEYCAKGEKSQAETILPDGCPEIVFNLSDRFKRIHSGFDETQPATLFAGQMSRSILIRPTGHVSLFGVRFHPAGAFPMGGLSMHELTDNIVEIGQVLGRCGRGLEERIAEANGFDERVGVFESFFLRQLAVRPIEDKIARFAAGKIVESGGFISVSRLAELIGISERRLERKFRKRVGISPKMLARTVRFQKVVNKIKDGDLLDTALSFGYFDQSHMIREFKEFSGETPLGYFRKTHGISDIFTSST